MVTLTPDHVPKNPFVLQPPVISIPMRLLLLGWVIGGVTILLGQGFGFDVSRQLAPGPSYVETVFAVMLMLGSLLVLLSTLHWERSSTSWQLELMGWPWLVSAWLIYVVIALILPQPVIFPTVLGFGYVAASGYRLTEVLRSIKVSRYQVDKMEHGKP